MNQTNQYSMLKWGTIWVSSISLSWVGATITTIARAQTVLPPPLIEGQPRQRVVVPPDLPAFPVTPDRGYLVYVRASDRRTLRRIRRLVPETSLEQYQGERVIKVGVYPDRFSATEIAERLSQRGFPTEIASLAPAIPAALVPPPPPGFAFPTAPGAIEYWVFVNGNSPFLLEQVQQVVPDAFVTQTNGRPIIQAGAFAAEGNARERLQLLRSRGILAEIATIPGAAPATFDLPLASVPPFDSQLSGNSSQVVRSQTGYYVIIPSSEEKIRAIANRVQQTIPNTATITPRRFRRGSHVAVGPYPNRNQAEEVRLVLFNSGLTNARVYFGP
ncbi:hypothetical protein [Roseofilum casamattae]|uniref:SPOR domain-containing protein n=1 Tax=Roseofilum casamattae BLCC-M143 TaxID=3022442 RepID=A0ABT7C2Z6_9CYAN|nr:hypothetical protein [Roseofilum casamattae]MDJ1185806.1 hypothetical protein [Roseofilum casamattae BLCC-M143]